jgi:hypothetical protein
VPFIWAGRQYRIMEIESGTRHGTCLELWEIGPGTSKTLGGEVFCSETDDVLKLKIPRQLDLPFEAVEWFVRCTRQRFPTGQAAITPHGLRALSYQDMGSPTTSGGSDGGAG